MPKCPICDTQLGERSFTETYISSFNNQEYRKYECPKCDLHWWEPLELMPEFYESEVFTYYISFHKVIRSRAEHYHKHFLNLKYPKGKLLDIGCGDGVFIKEAMKLGFTVYGIDFDAKSIETVKRNLNIETVYAMSLEEFYEQAKKENLKFDIITFFEVLEHQDKPKIFLKLVRDLLREEGIVAGSVPNRDSMFQVVLNQKIDHWVDHPPHHFLRFSEKAMKNILKICGFKEVEVYKLDFPMENLPAYIERKYLGKLSRLKNWFKRKAMDETVMADSISIEDLVNIKPTLILSMLKVLKRARAYMLFPFTLFYLNKLKEHGQHIYFQAKK